jgi:hypothetical protein
MITTLKEWQKFKLLEDAESNTINSDKEVKLKDYQEKINKYNSDKLKFKSIFIKDPKFWEDLANKIIDSNTYLGGAWKLAKMQHTLDEFNEKIKSGEMSQEEIKDIQLKIKTQTLELNKEKNELLKKIKDDLIDIQHL